MELLKIEFLTENYENIYIDGQYVGEFFIDQLPELHSSKGENGLPEGVCHYFYIQLYKTGNKKYQAYSQAVSNIIFSRLQRWNDITYITFHLIDPVSNICRTVCYAVKWAGLHDENNEDQVSYFDLQGNLHILIGQRNTD